MERIFKMAEELTVRDSSGSITQYGFSPILLIIGLSILIERHGGYYFGRNSDGSFNPDDIGVANEGSIKAFEELLELKEKGLTTQTPKMRA